MAGVPKVTEEGVGSTQFQQVGSLPSAARPPLPLPTQEPSIPTHTPTAASVALE